MIDLDKARAARREAEKEQPSVTLGGETFALPVELPFPVIQRMIKLKELREKGDVVVLNDAIESCIKDLLGKRFAAFMAHQTSLEDLLEFLDGTLDEYGVTSGESEASTPPSKTTGKRSRRTSRPSTA